MSDNTEVVLATQVQEDLKGSITTAEKYFAAMQKSAESCKIVLSRFDKEIATKDDDDSAGAALGQVKVAFDKVQGRRKEITGPLDALKQTLMEPEKTIDKEFQRVLALRNQWANKEANRIKGEQAAIQKAKDTELELVKIKDSITNAIETYMSTNENAVDGKLTKFFSEITMANYEEAAKMVTAVPSLKQESYEAFFAAPFPQYATADQVALVVKACKDANPYDASNTRFRTNLSVKLGPWIANLPAKKKELQDLEALKSTNAEAAANQEAALKQKADDDAAAAKKKEEEVNAAKQAELEQKSKQNQIGAEFTAQLQSQNVGTQTGVRKNKKAIITCAEKDMMVVLTELLYVCVTHPKHEGIYKKEKSGEVKMEDGQKVYADWLDGFLKFYATNCDTGIAGIEILDSVKAVTKKAV